jgi:diguanylate cyclase (GGDEF)-like protein
MKFTPSRVKIGGIAAACIMCLTAAVPPLSLAWVTEVRNEGLQVEARLLGIRRVLALLIDAETGQRGYVITGKEAFLQPYHAAMATLPGELAQLPARYTRATPQEQQLLDELLQNAEARLAGLTETVHLRRLKGFEAVEPIISTGEGRHHTDAVRHAVDELTRIEGQQHATLEEDLQSKIRSAILFSLVSTVLTLLLLGYLARVMLRAVRGEERSANQAQRTSQALEQGMGALKRRNEEISTLGEMSRVLQTEMSLAEALEITGLFCTRLLPGTAGTVFLFRNSADLLEQAASWGPDTSSPTLLEPASCWGLRRGQSHRHGGEGSLRCRHCAGTGVPSGGLDVCLPLVAQGDVLGLMHVRLPIMEFQETMVELAQTVSEQVALSLSNAKLRQVLRDQSIKEPLTGLYNRRFMEETLSKEISRALRNRQPLSLIVADLDHFKKINDAHGHAAGDAVLRAAARLLAQSVRASDVACRYGGEEFVLILPDCTKAHAQAKAEQIAQALRQAAVVENGAAIQVTASFGVAAAPEDGEDPAALFEAADRAVYAAKRTGRDRVVLAGAVLPIALGAPAPTTPPAVVMA